MNAQLRYEEEEFDNLELAREYRRQGHTFECSFAMIRGAECSCGMEGWKRSERADKIINFMRREG